PRDGAHGVTRARSRSHGHLGCQDGIATARSEPRPSCVRWTPLLRELEHPMERRERMMKSDLSMKWTMLATMTALAMGPGCGDELDDARDELELEAEDDDRGPLPSSPTDALSTHDHTNVVPGFALEISLVGDDVVLD